MLHYVFHKAEKYDKGEASLVSCKKASGKVKEPEEEGEDKECLKHLREFAFWMNFYTLELAKGDVYHILSSPVHEVV